MALLITEDNLWSAWHKLLCELVWHGEERAPRGFLTRELLGVVVQVKNSRANILDHPSRALNHKFMVGEWLWILSGSDDVSSISQYNSVLEQFSDDGVKLAGAYGPRIVAQVAWLRDRLREPDTRQGVVVLWSPNPAASKDIPCTVALQFIRRSDVLHLIVTMRSSDVWLGLPYDFYVFSQLLNCMAGELGCEQGWVQFQLGSSHLYERQFGQAEELLHRHEQGRAAISNQLPGFPPTWLYDVFRNPPSTTRIEGWATWGRFANALSDKKEQALGHLEA